MNREEVSGNEGFFGLGLAPNLLGIVERLGFKNPTPIQQRAIPIAVEGKDVIGVAQTGTGKTLAFALPMIQRLAATKGRGLILLPTRELALQVEETFQKMGRSIKLRTAVLIGGASMHMQKQAIKRDPHIIVATPGRLIDHLEQGTVRLDRVNALVLDEADRMFDMGFAPQIKRILQEVPSERQTMLFSATMPQEIIHLATRHMRLPVRVEVAQQGTTADKIDQEFFIVSKAAKMPLLESLLQAHRGTVLVFSRTKYGARNIAKHLNDKRYTAAELHSNRSLAQRKQALAGFKNGTYRVLVATDIAARGIDVKQIELVINFDLPDQTSDYVHRIGRTGRAGHSGHAISFATPDQRGDMQAIERFTRTKIRVTPLPSHIKAAAPTSKSFDEPDRPYGTRNRVQGSSQGGGGRSGTSRSFHGRRSFGQR
ncbi:MAG: DEAD/DEAH box helicase, partial [Patescibacteria group bacterium]